jgi:hypothetical protein
MKTSRRILFLVILLAVVLALPTSVLANKRLFRASMTTSAELHEVVGSNARGTFIIASFPDGVMRFQLSIRGLSGPATGVHLHGPATESETAPVLLSVCGSPAPAAVTTCPFDNGMLVLTGNVDSNLLASWGLRQRDFVAWLADGKIYVNAHTELNPAGEVRGQLYEP